MNGDASPMLTQRTIEARGLLFSCVPVAES